MKSILIKRPSGRKPSRVAKPLPSDDKKRSTEDDYKVLLQCLPHATVWYREHLQRTFDHIFSQHHEPRVAFPPRVRGHGRSKFTTGKYRTGNSIVTRNEWMFHGLALMDGDPDVIAISPYPLTIRYLGRNHEGTVEWKDHIPDIATLRRDGSVCFIDFIHDLDPRRDNDRHRELIISLKEDCSASYEVMWATQIPVVYIPVPPDIVAQRFAEIVYGATGPGSAPKIKLPSLMARSVDRIVGVCDDAMGNFTLEYPAAQQKRYGPVIERLVKTLKAPKNCE